MVKDSSGWGAMTGISSAYMAQSGFTGAPALIVEATECEVYWESLGQQWLVCEQYFKPYPVCRWAQAAIAAAQTLQATYDFTPEMIEHVEIFTFHEGCRLDHPRPTTTEQAQYSLPFPVAAILARGQCTAAEITTGLNDPNILNMANRIEMVEDTEYNRRFPAERLARAVIVLKDGRHLESPTTQAEGDPETPLSTDTFRAKYRDLVEPILGGKAADAVWDMAGSLAHGGTIEPFLETVLSPPGKMVGQVRKTN
jgi:2-methylcitrate dehydratase PrpD